MTAAAKNPDLSVLPPECRAPYARHRSHVWRNWRRRGQRQEHLIAGIHHALYGKKSGKLNDNARQLAFEDLEVALAGIEEKKSGQAHGAENPKRERVAKRNLGNRPRVACPGMAAGVAESDPASCRSFRDPQDHLHHHAMESRNRVILKSIKTRGAFRAGEAATRLICLAIRNVEKAGRNVREWFGARNQLAILFEDRFKA